MTRDWLPAEVDVLVAAYKADDWNGVNASIRRMLELDKDGAVVLTRAEAGTAYDVALSHLGVQGGRLSDIGFELRVKALAERLKPVVA